MHFEVCHFYSAQMKEMFQNVSATQNDLKKSKLHHLKFNGLIQMFDVY